MARSALLNVLVQAVLKAGKALSRDFGEIQNLQASLKGPHDFVYQARQRAETVLQAELTRARPTYGMAGKSQGTDGAHRWIICALDGTSNFEHGVPFFSTTAALERNGQVVASAIFNPATDELFTAERGHGAFLNDRRLRVGARNTLSDCVIGGSAPYLGYGNHGKFLLDLRNVMSEVAGVRTLGAASIQLAYVAAGRLDGFWARELRTAEIAAGSLLIREAGGLLTDAAGGSDIDEAGSIVAGNDKIQSLLLIALARSIVS